MVKQPLIALGATLFGFAAARAEEIDVAAWARSLPPSFSVAGDKVEPTYAAFVEIRRDHDVISVVGGAPAWMERSRESIAVDAEGVMRHIDCPKGMDCRGAPRPAGFLATASLLAASRRGELSGRLPTEAYGAFEVVCVPAEALGVEQPILDPCFERGSGAAIAQKSRFSHRFDGPSLDPYTLHISTAAKDKAS